MKQFITILITIITIISLGVCFSCSEGTSSQDAKDRADSNEQLEQYAKRQPMPRFDWSLEREMVRKLYDLRNKKVATHSVWRSALGTIEGDCSSIGFGIPYDTSLTNPLKVGYRATNVGVGIIKQHEPNGIFLSENTSATWVMCVGPGGSLEPHYVETKVTVYPYPVKVDYTNNRVTKAGKTVAKIVVVPK